MLFFRCEVLQQPSPTHDCLYFRILLRVTRGREMVATGPGREPMLHGPGALAFNLRVFSIIMTVHELFF